MIPESGDGFFYEEVIRKRYLYSIPEEEKKYHGKIYSER